MNTYRFQLLRYVPDSVKDEFVNIGVVVMDDAGRCLGTRMGGEEDLRRVRCLHPSADLDLVRAWQAGVEEELRRRPGDAGSWLEALGKDASHSLRWSEPRGCESEDAAGAVQALYESLVASPPRTGASPRPRTGGWVRREAESVFRAEHLLERFEAGIFADQFTYPGDGFRIQYRYTNSSPHYIHMLSLERSIPQSRALAFTFARITQSQPAAGLTAVVEDNPREVPPVAFARRLLEDVRIDVVPLDQIQGFVRRVKQDLGM